MNKKETDKMPKIKKRKPFFRFVKAFFRLFKKKPLIINLNETLPTRCIFISNHSAASGPFTLELYFPQYFTPWGTFEMNGNYKSRWKYLYHVYFQQKKGKGKFSSWILATLGAVLLHGFYKGMGLISTYPDSRLIKTFKQSIAKFDKDEAVLIYPENSSQGYKEILEEYNPGFVSLSKMYYNKRNIDLPIYTVYYHKKANALVIDNPEYIQPLLKSGLNEKEIAELFKDKTNLLREKYVLPVLEKKQEKKNKK